MRSPLRLARWLVLPPCFAAFLLAGAVPARAGGGSVDADDGDIHLNLHFRFLPQQQDIDRVQAQTQRASRILCDATDGQTRIGSMRLLAGGAAEPLGDIWYSPPGATTRSSASGRLWMNTGRIYLAHDAIRSDVLAHELGHLVFDLGDQYDEQRRMGGACGQGPSFDRDAMDETNHTIMQQAGSQICVTAAGNPTGRSCYDAADCGLGESCPLPALMSELSVVLNYDPLRGDEVLAVNSCPAPRAGDTLSVGGWLGEDLPGGLFDQTSFATADATATRKYVTDWIDADGDVPGYDEGSAHALYVYAEHVALNAWKFHFAMDGKHFDGGAPGLPVWVESCTVVMEDPPTFDVVEPDGSLFHHRRVASVNGNAGTSAASCEIPIADLANGAPDATLALRFDDFSEREGSAWGMLRRTSSSEGTRVLAGDVQQLGRCTETENCEMLWNTGTERWEASAWTRRRLRDDVPIESDWAHLVATAESAYGLTLDAPAGLPESIEPIPCAAPTEFEVDVAGADQVLMLIDRSRSMAEDREYVNDTRTRLDWAKAGARGFVALQSGAGVEVGLISFARDTRLDRGLAPVEPDGSPLPGVHEVSDFQQDVDALEALGATAIGDALALARDTFAAEPAGRTQAVFLLSDGENTAGDADPQVLADELRAAGIPVFTLPVGDAADGNLLARIAEETNGEVYSAPSALELPAIYADLYARLRGETPLFTRTPLQLAPPMPGSLTGPPVDVVIPIETGAARLNILLSNRNDLGESWAPGFRLLTPSGAQLLTHTHPSVVNDPFFRLLRVPAPQPGNWTLQLFATNPVAQKLYYWVHVENPLPDCWASATPAFAEVSGPTKIHAASSFQDPLGRGISYSASIRGPAGFSLDVPLQLDESLAGAEATLSGLTRHGHYDVVVRCESSAGARFTPGEQADTESVLAQGHPPPFLREARTSFFLDTPGYAPPVPSGDCDNDGIADAADGLTIDTDGDGLLNACDSDSDGDEIPDSDEPPGDMDGDGQPNFRDPDADGDSVFDAIDACIGGTLECPEPAAAAGALCAALALALVRRRAARRRIRRCGAHRRAVRRRRARAALALGMLAAPVATVASHAAILVTNTSDSGAGSLRAAIQQANAQAGLDTIQMNVPGTIALASPLPTLTDSLTIVGLGASQSGLDAQHLGRIVVVGSFGGGDTFRIEGFTFTGALEDGDGGALYLSGGNTLELAACTFAGNEATGNGGALRSNGSLTVEDGIFDANQCGNIGGAIYASDGDLTIRSTVFSDNHNPNRGGAVIASVPAEISDATFTGNQSIEGGALYFSGANLTVTRSHFDDNQAERGGGLFARCYDTAPCDPVQIADTTFSNNRALSAVSGSGGGLEALNVDLDVSNSTFSSNQTSGAGGGLYLAGATRARLVNLTIAANTAGAGGGVSSSSSLIVREIANDIVAGNGPDDCDRSLGVAGAHNASSDASCGFAGSGDRESVDPHLAPLADAGGPAPDHALLPGSPAIDAGDDATCTPLDQRGAARVRTCDLGAVEFAPEARGDALALLALAAARLRGQRRRATAASTANAAAAAKTLSGSGSS